MAEPIVAEPVVTRWHRLGTGAPWGTLWFMLEAIVIVFVLLVVIPVGFLMTMVLPAAVIGFLLKTNAEADNAGSELIETNT